MKSCPVRSLAVGGLLGLAVLLAGPARANAQVFLPPVSDGGLLIPGSCENTCCWPWANLVFPRTYSYYYKPWFNRPHHFPVKGPCGTYWATTVRGLPMGTPWLMRY